MLKQDIGKRAFLYGGVGAGMARAVADLRFREIGINTASDYDWSNSHSEHDANGDFSVRRLAGLVGI